MFMINKGIITQTIYIFINQKVWKLVPLPDGKIAIGTKWILKNKRDARGIVVRNKARLVAQGEAAPDIPQTILKTIQETRPEPDQSQEHLTTPPRPTTSDRIPLVLEQGHTSDPNITSFSGAHESDFDLFTSTNVEDETLGGSFHTTPPRSTQVPLVGPTSGGVADLATLTTLSSLVSELVQKVSTLESDLKAHKLLFTDVKALEVKLKTKKRKVSPGGPSKNPAECSSDPTSDVPSDGAPTGPSTVSPGSTTIPTNSSVRAAETIPASSGTTPETPSSPVRDARKGKGIAVEEPTLTHDKTFKQLEEERLGWEATQRLQAQE
ncbi:putative ribonuclease H-like domain-containing protein, partial [Tanacetum coccineum]